MSKYANLPDIDTEAPDVYETEDVFPSTSANRGDSSDDEQPSRTAGRGKHAVADKEELDVGSFMSAEEATKRFRKAERRQHHRQRTHYAYPPSPSASEPELPLPVAQRLLKLQAEVAALETELATNPDGGQGEDAEIDTPDPGELLKDLVDIRGRLEKMRVKKEGRGRLIAATSKDGDPTSVPDGTTQAESTKDAAPGKEEKKIDEEGEPKARSITEMDRRVGQLEELVGSSSTTLDESSPLPPPLLPLLTKLNSQLTLLTQPRHIDSISRRLKLLLSDLDRASAHSGPQRRPGHHASPSVTAATAAAAAAPSPLAEQLAPILSRLGPALPHIPHVLARLRTLSTLHASASGAQAAIEQLEAEQRQSREALEQLSAAVASVEQSLEDNRTTVEGNITGLEERIGKVMEKLESMER